MQLRNLNQSDFGPIFEVAVREFYTGALRRLYSKDTYIANTFTQLTRVFQSSDHCFLGLIDRDRIRGAILGYGLPDGIYTCPFLWVAPERRNQHHATTLCDVLLKQAVEKGYSKFVIETDPKSSALKKLLKNKGFHQSRIIWSNCL